MSTKQHLREIDDRIAQRNFPLDLADLEIQLLVGFGERRGSPFQ